MGQTNRTLVVFYVIIRKDVAGTGIISNEKIIKNVLVTVVVDLISQAENEGEKQVNKLERIPLKNISVKDITIY